MVDPERLVCDPQEDAVPAEAGFGARIGVVTARPWVGRFAASGRLALVEYRQT